MGLPPLPDMSQHQVHHRITILQRRVKVAHVPVVMEQVIAQCVKEKVGITPIPAHIPVQAPKHGINVAHAMAQVNAVYVMDREQ